MGNNLQVIDLVIRIFVIGLITAWCFILIRPFIALVLWASILSIALYPIFLWLKKLLGGRSKLAVTLITLLGLAVIIGPVSFITTVLISNIQTLADNVAAGALVVPPPPEGVATWPLIGESLNNTWQQAALNLGDVIDKFEPQLKGLTKTLLLLSANTGLTLLKFIFSLIIAAGLMLNAEEISRGLTSFLNRLSPTQGKTFLQLAEATVRNVTRGVIGIAILQSLLIGIGFTVAGIPGAGLLSLLCLFLTVIQIGPGLIVLATLVYAWSTMSSLSATVYLKN